MKWAIFYDDGTVCLQAEAVKKHGVVCVLQEDGDRRNIQSRLDYYVLTDTWLSCDTFGVLDHVLHKLKNINLVVAGRTVSNDKFEKIYNQVKKYVFQKA